MAREAGCDELYAERVLIGIHFKTHSLKAFEVLVRADQREIDAKVCEEIYAGEEACGDWPTPEMCADAIRSREQA
jgi:hypothetical protein